MKISESRGDFFGDSNTDGPREIHLLVVQNIAEASFWDKLSDYSLKNNQNKDKNKNKNKNKGIIQKRGEDTSG